MNYTKSMRPRADNPSCLIALCVGLIVLPLYACQSLAAVLGHAFNWPDDMSGTFAMLSVAGYALGLLFLVPLADTIENRRLICTILSFGTCALGLASIALGPRTFGAAIFLAGACCSGIQILVPLAIQRVPEAERGRTIGNVMSGLMFGIFCSRPIASITTEHFGWRATYGLYGSLTALCAICLYFSLPQRKPPGVASYRKLLVSMWVLVRSEPVLRTRALLQGLCMAAFSMFWTTVSIRLQAPPFSLGGDAIGIFALAGAAGIVIAPVAGRIGDSGRTVGGSRAAYMAILVGAILAAIGGANSPWTHANPAAGIAILSAAAFVVDLGVIGDQTLGRRLVNLLNPDARGRLNGLYTGLFFIGSAIGSALGGGLYARFGWYGTCLGCAVLACVALVINMCAPSAMRMQTAGEAVVEREKL